MVDRIVPATTDEHHTTIRERFGIDDAWPVVTEPFRQWVVEDRFCNGRPDLDRVGVLFTTDVAPYEKMKMRLLNGSHQALAHVGRLLGFEFAHEAIADAAVLGLVRRLMDAEVTPLLDAPAGIDLGGYKRTLLERFANPTIRDRLARIATDASARMPKFVLPSLATQIERDGPIEALCFTLAAWFHGLAGRADDGRLLETGDAMRAQLIEAAGDRSLAALFGLEDLVDARIAASSRCRDLVRCYVASFRVRGCRATLDEVTQTWSVRA
jgi:mannitol 2-dehydrogenase